MKKECNMYNEKFKITHGILHFEFCIAWLRAACIRSEKFGNMGHQR
jgi:hypothetical protein